MRALLILSVIIVVFIQYFHGFSKNPQLSTHPPATDLTILNTNDLEKVDQRNSQLIQYIRLNHLIPPSQLPTNLDSKIRKSKFPGWITSVFENMRFGKFIEAGIRNGDTESYTMPLEQELGWTGLVVECNKNLVPFLKSKNRNVWIADVCLSPTGYAGSLNFSKSVGRPPSGTAVIPKGISPTKQIFFNAQAIPLYTILAAVGWNHVDLFIFNIEGQELAVFNTFPFDLVRFKVIIIFYPEHPASNKNNQLELNKLLQSKGYIPVQRMRTGLNRIFVHESFKIMEPRPSISQQKSVTYTKRSFPTSVLVTARCGIGNQLFQYACHYALAKELNMTLYIQDKYPKTSRTFSSGRREFALDKFHIPMDAHTKVSTITAPIFFLNNKQLLEKSFLPLDTNYYQYISINRAFYCQSREYWREFEKDIRKMFQVRSSEIRHHKIRSLERKITEAEESVAVHVRRGDFETGSLYYMPISYQRRAIRKMISLLEKRGTKKPVFFVFSDDIPYAKRELEDLGNFTTIYFATDFVQEGTSIEEFYLMRLCKHVIFPNSSYSWWVAYLNENKDKIVIASVYNPKYNQLQVSGPDSIGRELYGKLFHLKEWIVINPFTGGMEVVT